ncbi:MAG TPA: BTAD domain-containing putative transcriptional regulator [Nocardioidaceae bacterium]|jgi:DNA-binding SARP family transcriptional activator|nr:BTAD domain-containing putative transcriptional regulator [Nocardioidaceae bacterium]
MLTITLFGPTTVGTADGRTITAADLGGVKPRQILEVLAVHAGTPVAKDRLAELLWDGEPPKTYVGTLESYVCVLRRCLGLTGRRSVLATTSSGYVLDPDQVRVDLATFRSLVRRSAAAVRPEESVALTEKALVISAPALLASDAYASWAETERNCVRQELVTACVRAAEQAVALDRPEVAVRLARAAVERDRYAEDAVRALMQALWLSGRRCEALNCYASLRAAMVEELGLEPGAETYRVYMRVLQDGTAGPTVGTERAELSTLLGLLRQTLASIPGVELPHDDGALAQVAMRVLEVA